MTRKLRFVFLGTPDVVVPVLDCLRADGREWAECVGVVAQPPARSGRSSAETPCPVHSYALQHGLEVITPEKIGSAESLEQLKKWQSDLFVTAAYGQYLPSAVLSVPILGTLNIHPSLLPKYRGAAPVQHTLLKGDKVTGVSLLLSVKEMDAGPIVSQIEKELTGDEHANELLTELFRIGALKLVGHFEVWQSTLSSLRALPSVQQSSEGVVFAPKLSAAQAWVDWSQGAEVIHNQVRGLSIWPGTKCRLRVGEDLVECKIIKTLLCYKSAVDDDDSLESRLPHKFVLKTVTLDKNDAVQSLCFTFDQGPALRITSIQPVGKRVMEIRDFANSLVGKTVEIWQDSKKMEEL